MSIIFHSLFLSIGVFARMVLPSLGIYLASMVVWFLAGMITAGLSGYVSESVTAAFVTLVGIRAALAMKGDHRPREFRILAFNSLTYGVFLVGAKAVMILIANLLAVLLTDWNFGEAVSFHSITNAEERLQALFVLHAVAAKVIIALALIVALSVTMAVPMAAAAQSASYGAPSRPFFWGFGRSFLPLFLIFAVSYLFQLYFELFGYLFAVMPTLVISIVSMAGSEEFPSIPLDVIGYGVLAFIGHLWLQSWIWSASALAFLKYEEKAKAAKSKHASSHATTTKDLRAMRKAREQGGGHRPDDE